MAAASPASTGTSPSCSGSSSLPDRGLAAASKYVRFRDTSSGKEWLVEVPPESAWNQLLPAEQTSLIRWNEESA